MTDKEFWEKCGLKGLVYKRGVWYYWLYYTDEEGRQERIPTEDSLEYLGFLFKYAVPKCKEIYVNTGDGETNAGARQETWVTTKDKDPAQALKKAIEEVLK